VELGICHIAAIYLLRIYNTLVS